MFPCRDLSLRFRCDSSKCYPRFDKANEHCNSRTVVNRKGSSPNAQQTRVFFSPSASFVIMFFSTGCASRFGRPKRTPLCRCSYILDITLCPVPPFIHTVTIPLIYSRLAFFFFVCCHCLH